MPYVKRIQKRIVAISKIKSDECNEWLEDTDNELSTALIELIPNELGVLQSDLEMIRVIEDVIDALVAKSVINMSDLPQPVQIKLLKRKKFRIEGKFQMGDPGLIHL